MATATEDLTDSDREAIERTNASADRDSMPPHDPSGRSIEDMAEEGEDGEGQTFLDFGQTLTTTLKGKKPNESKIKIRAIQRDISGQLGDKGDDEEVFVLVRATLDEVQMKTFRDDSRKVRSKRRLHILEPVNVARVPEEVAEDLFDQFS